MRLKAHPLDGEELLAIFLDVFGEDGLRVYIVGHLEGVADALWKTQRMRTTAERKGTSRAQLWLESAWRRRGRSP